MQAAGVQKRCPGTRLLRDLLALCGGLGATLRRTERLWILLGYLELSQLTRRVPASHDAWLMFVQ